MTNLMIKSKIDFFIIRYLLRFKLLFLFKIYHYLNILFNVLHSNNKSNIKFLIRSNTKFTSLYNYYIYI